MLNNKITNELKKLSDPKRARASAWFFKTGPGQYGEGDVFLGIRVPVMRQVAHRYLHLEFGEIRKLLASPVHEHRFVALEILVENYEKGDATQKKKVAQFYLANRKYVNNWDLVDTSAPYILGDFLLRKDKNILLKMAKSKNIWDRRIAIVATAGFIKQKEFAATLKIAEILLKDKHDLIHKAVGWMLREVGNRSMPTELRFLDKYAATMPRTMLRYAIEKFPSKLKLSYMKLGRNRG